MTKFYIYKIYFSFIDGEHTQKFWVVGDDSEEAQLDLIRKFIEFAETEASRMTVDGDIIEAIQTLENFGRNPPDDFDLSDIFKLKGHLKQFCTLPTYGFNSSRYDLAIIFDLICKVYDTPGFDRKSVNLLKKGKAYFSCSFGSLHFKDLLNFTCPMSLDSYLKTWTSDCEKLLYPYELFGSIEEIRNQLDFPVIEDFATALKPHVDLETYRKCRDLFNERINLPADHPDKWFSFEDYLKYYNLSDVYPASLAMMRQFQTYHENFGTYPNHFLGLPSFAKYCMFALYNPESPNIFSFPDTSDATKVFREGMIGGLTNVYKRHVTLDEDEEAATAAKYSKRGKKWKKIEFYDINSMYPSTYNKKFPTGLGFEWELCYGSKLKKKLMTKRKISIESLEWLEYQQKDWFKSRIFF